MIKTDRFLILVFAALVIQGCSDRADVPEPAPAPEPAVLADFSGLEDGWNRIEPGGNTVCSDGSPYHFHVRAGDPEKLLFYLEGGGACWMGLNCDPTLQPSYQINLANTDPSRAHGIFAFDQPRNPFADYTVVMAPYCSGDVHLGDIEQTYQVPPVNGRDASEVHVRHRGWANAQAAMNWAFEHVYAPQTVFVTGSSAGSIPAPFYAVRMADHFNGASVVALGDGSGGYRGFGNFTPHEAWAIGGVINDLEYTRDMAPEEFSFHHLYIAAARQNPTIVLSSFDTAEDDVQKQFLALGGAPAEYLQPLLEANLNEISEAAPAFRYYVAGGDMHTILLRPEVYSYNTNGLAFVDWLAGLANGAELPNVMCGDCSAAP